MVVKVQLLVEPPLKWPLWFDNEIRDDVELAPVSPELRKDLINLCKFFDNNTDWNDEIICYFWTNAEGKRTFDNLLHGALERLAQELGEGYEIESKMFDLPTLPPR